MKNGKSRHLLRAVAFCVILLCCVALASRIVERKASINRFGPFLDSAGEYDVLFVGDSQVVNGVFPMELWHNYGIASYNMSCYGNTLPVTYWTTMLALDYASPKLVVIGVKDVDKSYKLSGSSSDVHTALDCFPLSPTKIRAIEDLMDDPNAVDDNGDRYVDLKGEYYFTLGKYHSRWSELGPGDFTPVPNRQKGGEMAVGVGAAKDYDIIDEASAMEESGFGFAYLRRLIEACQERNIEVMLVHMPYPASEKNQMAANAVGSIAQEYDIGYVDFVSLDQVADYATDCFDSHSHLNSSGAQKVTDYLGRYISDHYDVPNRRDEAPYQHWDSDYDAFVEEKLGLLRAQHELDNVLMLLHDGGYSVCITIRAGSALYQDETLMRLMQNIAREHVFEEDEFAKWSNSLFPLERLDAAAGQDYFLLVDRARGAIFEHAGEGHFEADASFGAVRYDAQGGAMSLSVERDGAQAVCIDDGADGPNVRILVVDDRNGEIAATFAFEL